VVRLEVIELTWGCHNIILCGQLRSGKSLSLRPTHIDHNVRFVFINIVKDALYDTQMSFAFMRDLPLLKNI
jgi:hypothetical protein